jgi:hypothetical protein
MSGKYDADSTFSTVDPGVLPGSNPLSPDRGFAGSAREQSPPHMLGSPRRRLFAGLDGDSEGEEDESPTETEKDPDSDGDEEDAEGTDGSEGRWT